jgi:hypothetical protein
LQLGDYGDSRFREKLFLFINQAFMAVALRESYLWVPANLRVHSLPSSAISSVAILS